MIIRNADEKPAVQIFARCNFCNSSLSYSPATAAPNSTTRKMPLGPGAPPGSQGKVRPATNKETIPQILQFSYLFMISPLSVQTPPARSRCRDALFVFCILAPRRLPLGSTEVYFQGKQNQKQNKNGVDDCLLI